MKTDSCSRGKRRNKWYAVAIVLALVVGVAGLLALRRADNRSIEYDAQTLEKEAQVLSDVVDVDGVPCIPKKNIRSYLIIGVDNTAAQGENYVMGGQSDVLVLLVVDHTNMTYQRLPINRNTICKVRAYGVDGEDLGTSKAQIAFAHSTGGGGALSSENTVEAVSNLLGGVDIQNYITVDMGAIPKINQLVDGVTVTIEDDFSQADPSLVKGATVTLTDEQAEHFVRDRMNMLNDDTNEGRMRRQEVYLEGLRQKMLERAKEDAGYALAVYDDLTPDMETNMNGKAFSRLVNGLTECEDLGTLQITGKVGEDEFGFATFVPDKESLRDAEISMFYRPAEE